MVRRLIVIGPCKVKASDFEEFVFFVCLRPMDVPRPLTNDLWVFLFQTIDAECVK